MHQAGRNRGTGKPIIASALQARVFGRDPISAEGIMASGQCKPHQQVEHMAAPTSSAEPFKSLLPTESRPHMAMSFHAHNSPSTAQKGS
jgi:hypothetical protein